MLMNVINRVGEMDKRIIDCARALNVSTPTMLFKIILPYCVPGILGGFSVSISISFMILTMAEMIGVDSGIGYFVSRSAENSQYAKVIAGIILIGFMVTCLNGLVNMAKKRFLRWI
jgi:NitT/TauT family transport system permease protein